MKIWLKNITQQNTHTYKMKAEGSDSIFSRSFVRLKGNEPQLFLSINATYSDKEGESLEHRHIALNKPLLILPI